MNQHLLHDCFTVEPGMSKHIEWINNDTTVNYPETLLRCEKQAQPLNLPLYFLCTSIQTVKMSR